MVTLTNIKAYLQGNIRMILDKLPNNLITKFIALPLHHREQVAYRMDMCKDTCITKCKFCGCNTPGKFFVSKQCGANRYPDFMGLPEWEAFKKQHNVTI